MSNALDGQDEFSDPMDSTAAGFQTVQRSSTRVQTFCRGVAGACRALHSSVRGEGEDDADGDLAAERE